MLGSFSYVFLGLAIVWNILPILSIIELNPLTELYLVISFAIPALFLTVKAVRGKKWSLPVITLSTVMSTSHLIKELPIGIYFWLVGLIFCGIAFYCHVRLINRGRQNQQA
ncbi:hypothetical protein [Endozoicomonas arenosclerae]|uniref:hypothetical protein n=1 Tax=Endozoicomonas arenosclerae TaxID=1633495 RepID=UPI000784E661|nr:hypothetical protein [Endozoicomonas arenosclerae]